MTMAGIKIITPYVFEEEIMQHKDIFWELDIHYERDVAGIGSDLMFQKMWKQFPNDDISIVPCKRQKWPTLHTVCRG
jgi:hypothetical protein